MTVANPREVPEYELNPHELQIRKGAGISKVRPFFFQNNFFSGKMGGLSNRLK